VLSFDQIIAQMKELAKNESPIVGLMEPKDAGKEKIKAAGKDSADVAGQAIVTQATEGKYGEKAITNISTQLKSKEADIKQSGQQVADWLGGALLERFNTTVPTGLLDILVNHLEDRIAKSESKKTERTSGSTGPQ
jgi:phage terminase large subunit-like protein